MAISLYFERIRRAVGHDLLLCPAACAIVHNDDGEVLLMRRCDNGKWEPPGGFVDPDETPAQAAERETLEETGLIVRAVRLIGLVGGKLIEHQYPNGDLVQPLVVCFECAILSGTLHSADGEATEFGYFRRRSLPLLSTPYPTAILFPDSSQSAFFQRTGG